MPQPKTKQQIIDEIRDLLNELEALQEGDASAQKLPGHSDPGDDDEGPNG